MFVSGLRTSAITVLTLLLLAGGGSISAAAPVTAPVAAPVAAKSASGTGAIRMGSFNIRGGVSTGTFLAAVTAFTSRVDVGGLQEVNSKDKQAALATLPSWWQFFRPANNHGEQVPILWNTNVFRLVSARSVKTAGATNVGNEVPGKAGERRARFATVVRLVHLDTDVRISVVNVHLPAGAVKSGVRQPGRPRLFRLYVEEMARVAKLARAEQQWGQPFVLGDFNVGWVADEKHRTRRLPFRKFKAAGMRSMWATNRPAKGGTRLKALLDQVYSTKAADYASVERDINLSDHWPAIANYTLRP